MANNKSIHFLRGTADKISANATLVLDAGQPLYDLTNNKLYVGNGTDALANLTAIGESGGAATSTAKYLHQVTLEFGVCGGVNSTINFSNGYLKFLYFDDSPTGWDELSSVDVCKKLESIIHSTWHVITDGHFTIQSTNETFNVRKLSTYADPNNYTYITITGDSKGTVSSNVGVMLIKQYAPTLNLYMYNSSFTNNVFVDDYVVEI